MSAVFPFAEETGEAVHFLHIGKCAGTQIRSISESLESERGVRIVAHDHDIALADIPPEDRYFFAIRHPASRFRSGFYSRKRRGRPVYGVAWSSGEQRAFSYFEHANDLAEALFAEGEPGRQAFMAIRSIRHTAQNQVDWFCMAGDMFESRPPVWIVRQEHFASDIAELLARIGSANGAAACGSASHRNDYAGVPDFSAKALGNLERWYAQDYEFYRMCEDWIGRQKAAILGSP